MTAAVMVVCRWPVLDPAARLTQLEPQARAEWPGILAGLGLWGSTDPQFAITENDPGQAWDEDETGDDVAAVLVATAHAIHGPLEPRSLR